MSDIIVAEHFTLGPQRKRHLTNILKKLQALLDPESRVEVAIRLEAHEIFTCNFNGRMLGKCLSAHNSSRNFYDSVNHAKSQLTRQIIEQRQKRLSHIRRAHLDKGRFIDRLRFPSEDAEEVA